MADKNLKNFYNNIMRDKALLYKNQFYVEVFAGTYVGRDTANPAADFSYYVQSADIPGSKLVNGKTVFFGTEFRIPGVKQFDHNWSVNILLDQDLTMFKKLERWRNDISSLKSNGGGNKHLTNYYAKVHLLNETHTSVVQTFIIAGIWIKSLGDINLAYANGGGDVLKIPAEFRYQYIYRENDGDPIGATGN
jgi:hypothetical protein